MKYLYYLWCIVWLIPLMFSRYLFIFSVLMIHGIERAKEAEKATR